MKIFFTIIVLSLALASCKKEDSHQKEPLISAVKYNGLIGYKFQYNNRNLWTSWELHKTDATDNTMSVKITFEYNDKDQLTKTSIFDMPGDVARTRVFYEYDNAGTQTGYTYYDLQGADPSKPSLKGTFTYNAQKLLSTAIIREADGELHRYYSLSYYPNGFAKERNEYDETVTNQLRLLGKVVYSVPDVNIAKGWEKLESLPLDGDDLTRKPKYETIQRYTYKAGVLTNNIKEIASGKEYNADGTLKRLTSTLQYILPAKADEVNVFEFEYIQQ
jgi:hypothetical protein